MRMNSVYSGSEDEMRRQMSWAEQVDIAYPLDECVQRAVFWLRQRMFDCREGVLV